MTTVAVVVADMATKMWALSALADGPIDIGWITLRLAQNPGIAFSLGADAPSWVVTAVTVTATLFIAAMALRGTLRPPLAGGLLLGGGLGNLLDRLAGGTVTDFLDLGWFPSFNVADVALNVGVALVLITALLFDRSSGDRADEDDRSSVGDRADEDDRADEGVAEDGGMGAVDEDSPPVETVDPDHG